ncbi:MAG: hypothetical protein PHQ43_13345, partial [Dehalococcoidales bacterium]|nr:hypothetical protein [Dehalococcoidales bacterium]
VFSGMRFLNNVGNGILTALEILVPDTTPGGMIRLGVYQDVNGRPGQLLLDAGERPVITGWNAIGNLSLPVLIGTYYWLAYVQSAANVIRYQSGSPVDSRMYAYSSYGPMPAQFPSAWIGSTNQYVIRAYVLVESGQILSVQWYDGELYRDLPASVMVGETLQVVVEWQNTGPAARGHTAMHVTKPDGAGADVVGSDLIVQPGETVLETLPGLLIDIPGSYQGDLRLMMEAM